MAKKKKGSKELTNREIRKRRRKKAQILSYITAAALFAAILTGGILGGKFAMETILNKRQEARLEKETAALAELDEDEEEETEPEEEETEKASAEYTEEDLLDEMVNAALNDMPLEDRVAGMFLTTPEDLTDTDTVTKAGEGTAKALAEYAVGGLVYSKKNVQSAEQFSQMISDTVAKSKYLPFFILDDTAEALTEDLSVYGINMEFDGKTEDGDSFRTRTLPSLRGDEPEDGLLTVIIRMSVSDEGEEEEEETKAALADACLEAWENGADLLYVPDGFKDVCPELTERIRGDDALEARVEETLARIYHVKYKNRLSE